MGTPAVAFTSPEPPEIFDGAAMGFPGNCVIFRWGVEFFITEQSGLNPTTSEQTGFVVQKADVKKDVVKCDGSADSDKSETKTVWEYFNIENGVTNVDVFQIGFPANRKTTVDITLSASFHNEINGATKNPINPPTFGANGTLSGQPSGFSITLTRTLKASVNCCDEKTYAGVITAGNKWNTYSESWGLKNGQEKPKHDKEVDGKKIEDDE